MIGSAQLVPVLPPASLLLVIAVPLIVYATSSLMGRALRLPPRPGWRIEAGIGAVTGFLGGLTGVWGPTTVAMLTALETPKREQVRSGGRTLGVGRSERADAAPVAGAGGAGLDRGADRVSGAGPD